MILLEGDIPALAKALAAAQKAYKPVVKTGLNTAFAKGRSEGSKYATLDDLFTALMPALNANGLALIQGSGNTEGLVNVHTMLLHESGATASCRLETRLPANATPQNVGSALTYLRRYGVQALCGLNGEIDDDGNEASRQGTITPEQVMELLTLAKDVGADIPKFEKHLKIAKLTDLPFSRFAFAKEALEAKRKANAPAENTTAMSQDGDALASSDEYGDASQ